MHLYRFINKSAVAADSCVIFASNNCWGAIRAYVERYHPLFKRMQISKDFEDGNAILLEESYKSFEGIEDGRVLFSKVFAIKIS